MYAVVKTGEGVSGFQRRPDPGRETGRERGRSGGIERSSDGLQRRRGAVWNSHLAGVVIKGEIVQESKGEKVLTYKMKRRKNYRRFKGHRQTYTTLKVNDINLG